MPPSLKTTISGVKFVDRKVMSSSNPQTYVSAVKEVNQEPNLHSFSLPIFLSFESCLFSNQTNELVIIPFVVFFSSLVFDTLPDYHYASNTLHNPNHL